MTRASPARRERRLGRGRPRNDDDLITIEFALALKKAWGLSERKAFDFVVARFKSRATEPTKIPRGARKRPGGGVVGYETFPKKTVSGRAATLRQGKGRARQDVVHALTLALRCRDARAAHQLFEQLLILTAVAGPDRLRRVITELSS